MDGDLQDQPEFIPCLYEEAMKGYDVVFASRQRRPEKKYYLFIQKLFYLILRILSGIKFDSSHANFSIISRKVVAAYRSFPESSRFYVSTVKWLGFRTNSIKVGHGKRFSGTPSYTFKSRIKLATDIIISFSQRPLNFSIYLGSITAIISANLIIYFLLNQQKELINPANQTGIILIILTMGGIIMILLGILGAYVGRIFQQVKGRPLYIESDKINVD
jgi:dolichol-phosphate mannosyltransferase